MDPRGSPSATLDYELNRAIQHAIFECLVEGEAIPVENQLLHLGGEREIDQDPYCRATHRSLLAD